MPTRNRNTGVALVIALLVLIGALYFLQFSASSQSQNLSDQIATAQAVNRP